MWHDTGGQVRVAVCVTVCTFASDHERVRDWYLDMLDITTVTLLQMSETVMHKPVNKVGLLCIFLL
jgi:hypothetical protein